MRAFVLQWLEGEMDAGQRWLAAVFFYFGTPIGLMGTYSDVSTLSWTPRR